MIQLELDTSGSRAPLLLRELQGTVTKKCYLCVPTVMAVS